MASDKNTTYPELYQMSLTYITIKVLLNTKRNIIIYSDTHGNGEKIDLSKLNVSIPTFIYLITIGWMGLS